MPYARGPYARGPYALCQIVPHVTEKGYKKGVFNRQDWKHSLSNIEIHLRSEALVCGFPIYQKLMQ